MREAWTDVKSHAVSATEIAVGPALVSRHTPTKAITCTAAVALMLATTRWGSYIGVSPVFLTDLLILAAVLDRLIARTQYRVEPVRAGFRATAPKLVVIFLGYVVVRMLLSGPYVFSVTWLRDGAPYLYGVLALVSAHSVARASERTKNLTMRWVWWALIFHLVWVCGVGVVGSTSAFATPHPFFGGGIFDARPDVDSAVLGITAGLLVRRALLGQRRALAIAGSCRGRVRGRVLHVAGGLYRDRGLLRARRSATPTRPAGALSLRRIGMALTVPVVLFGGDHGAPVDDRGITTRGDHRPEPAPRPWPRRTRSARRMRGERPGTG